MYTSCLFLAVCFLALGEMLLRADVKQCFVCLFNHDFCPNFVIKQTKALGNFPNSLLPNGNSSRENLITVIYYIFGRNFPATLNFYPGKPITGEFLFLFRSFNIPVCCQVLYIFTSILCIVIA